MGSKDLHLQLALGMTQADSQTWLVAGMHVLARFYQCLDRLTRINIETCADKTHLLRRNLYYRFQKLALLQFLVSSGHFGSLYLTFAHFVVLFWGLPLTLTDNHRRTAQSQNI